MNTLLIDIETYSSVDIGKCGVYKYVESDDFDIILFSYSVDGAPAQLVDLAKGEVIPADVRDAITNPDILKIAHNMVFEITSLSKYLGKELDPEQWQDTMHLSAYLGLPLALGQVGDVLRLEQQKLASGKRLIKLFSCPDKRGKRIFPEDKPDKWEEFKAYCVRDVDTEVELYRKVKDRVVIPAWEREMQLLDYRINKRGVRVDKQLAENAVHFWDICRDKFIARLKEITGVENPNSVAQLKEWLKKRTHKDIDSLNKLALQDLLKLHQWGSVGEVLRLRQELGKTSVKKYEAMLNCICTDGRAHGITQYYGTTTGRFAGRMIQTQNLPQNHITDLSFARTLLYNNAYEDMEMSYSSVTDTLSQLIRTALIPSDGNIFHICDFSAIECRVVAWLAGEQWVLDVFRKGGDIYCATASKMFGVPVEKHGQNSELRQKGKIATLALGYQGGVGALKTMGGERMGLTEDEMKNIVRMWRGANKSIVALWATVEKAATCAITTGQSVKINHGITFSMHFGFLHVTLPSGRTICYPRAKMIPWEDGRQRISYERTNQETKKWERAETYGGKMVENIVQAVARDILVAIMLRTERAGLPIVFHVHDEIIVDAPKDRTLAEIEAFFAQPIPWAPGLPLKGAGYSGQFYFKD